MRLSLASILLYAALLAVLTSSPSTGASTRFRRLTVEDGLSAEGIFTVLQDKRGYIWLATANGLDRYDGYEFKIFKHDPNNPSSLSADLVRALYEDATGRLWVGTYGGGLDSFDEKTQAFQHYKHSDDNPNSLSSNRIWSLGEDNHGTLLVGTFDAGFDTLDPVTGLVRRYPTTTNDLGPSDKRINKIFSDKDGHTWLATESGLDMFDGLTGKFIHYRNQSSSPDANVFWDVSEDAHKQLWLATQSGPALLASATGATAKLGPAVRPTSPVAESDLRCIHVDSHGNTWFGTTEAGLYLQLNNSN